MKDLFKGAEFGDRFVTRDGHAALFIYNTGEYPRLVVEDTHRCEPLCYGMDGTCYESDDDSLDIVSKAQAPVPSCLRRVISLVIEWFSEGKIHITPEAVPEECVEHVRKGTADKGCRN